MIVFKTTQAQVLDALQAVAGIVERRHTLPVLAHVLIRKTGDRIEFTTSDLDLQARTTATLGGDAGAFETTVGARKLVDILRALPADQAVTLTAQGARLSLQAGRGRFTLHALPPEQFPLVAPAPDLGQALQLPQALLRRLITQVDFAMAVHDIRYYLNGVLLVIEGDVLRVVATDGNRLALAEAALPAALPAQQVILPRKAVHELQRLLSDAAPDDNTAGWPMAELRLGAAQAQFKVGSTELVCKLIEGRFPDFRRVIPQGHPHAVTLARAPLLASLQRASILTSEKFKGIRVNLEPGALRILSSNAQHEEADEDLEVDYAGSPIEIGFNVGYLLDVLSQADDEWVTLALRDPASSVLLTFPQRDGFKYVVSPMRL